METLDYISVKPLGITEATCRRYSVPQIKTRDGVKLGAIFSEDCARALSMDGGGFWVGTYDANLGLFGQKVITPGEPAIIVTTELEALKLASLGYPSLSLPEFKDPDGLGFSILAENLSVVTKELWVWGESAFKHRSENLERFLLHLISTGKFTVKGIDGSNSGILTTASSDLKEVLSAPTLLDWKPNGVAFLEEIMDDKEFFESRVGYSTGYPCIDRANRGVRTSEVTTFTAGTGVGKSTIVREIACHLATVEHLKVGMIFLEESARETAKSLAAILNDIPLCDLEANPKLMSEKQWDAFRKTIGHDVIFNKHFGSLSSDVLFNKIEYMVLHGGCRFICLDHISIAVSGMSSKEGERKDIDILMTRLATTAVALDVGFLVVSHLSQPEGAPHEEGGRVTMSQLRGSGAIKQLSWSIFALERNQQDPDSTAALIRQLKGRKNNGDTGPIGVIEYNKKTGRLKEVIGVDVKEFERAMQPQRRGKQPYAQQSYVPKNYGTQGNDGVGSKWVGGY